MKKSYDKIVFLDIDCVLNDGTFDEQTLSTTIDRPLVQRANQILDAHPDAKVVISSSWRYLILRGAMTLSGFESFLRTHGLHVVNRVIGFTISDEETDGIDDHKKRGKQIQLWLKSNPATKSFVVLDDLDVDLEEIRYAGRHVRTVEGIGLTDGDVNRAIKILSVEMSP